MGKVQRGKCNICLSITMYLLYIFAYHGSFLCCVPIYIPYLLVGFPSDPNRAKPKLSKADFQNSFGMDEKVNILFRVLKHLSICKYLCSVH